MRDLAHQHVDLFVVVLVVRDVPRRSDDAAGRGAAAGPDGDPPLGGGIEPLQLVFELVALVHGIVGLCHEAGDQDAVALAEQGQEARQRETGYPGAADHRLDGPVALDRRSVAIERPKARPRRLERKSKALF